MKRFQFGPAPTGPEAPFPAVTHAAAPVWCGLRRAAVLVGALACGAAGLALSSAPATAQRDNDPDAYVVNFFTGGGSDGVLFAAGSANQKCTSLGLAQIQVLSTSPGVRLTVQPGNFVVTGTDYGYLVCLGQRIPGTIVTGSGTGEARIRVSYPPIGQWYDHTLTLTGR
ncbi:MAG: hypothetical protein B7Z15_05665 [Rhizobiales bacterium 32-66-8]|nr:MAG: hypothetical protein B7Z15_05665 [Rhizobiales bacterium 32-66-8]